MPDLHSINIGTSKGQMMDDICTYTIQLSGQVNESEINAMSPIQMNVERVGQDTTLFTVCTDQSGLIGLMRHLHGLGLVFLSVGRSRPLRELHRTDGGK